VGVDKGTHQKGGWGKEPGKKTKFGDKESVGMKVKK